MGKTITVKALDADHKFKYSWPAMLLSHKGNSVVLYGEWGRLLHHASGERVPITNQSIEFCPRNCPYVVSIMLDRKGKIQEYYGRVTLPPLIYQPEKQISFVMLGVDLQVKPNFDYEILDSMSQREGHSTQLQQGLLQLVELIERREGPFDRKFLRAYLDRIRESCRGMSSNTIT